MKVTSRIQHIVRNEWIIVTLVLLTLAGLLGYKNGLGRLDMLLYDQAIQLNPKPSRDDILIIAIDDYSLAQLGKWPWPRKIHAQLFEKINQAEPNAVGFDVLFNDPENLPEPPAGLTITKPDGSTTGSADASTNNPAEIKIESPTKSNGTIKIEAPTKTDSASKDGATANADSTQEAQLVPEPEVNSDVALSDAIGANHVTVLPITIENTGNGLTMAKPLPMYQKAAGALGHINLEMDEDGFARSVFLTEGQNQEWVPHFSLAMYNLIKHRPVGDTRDIRFLKFKNIVPNSANSWLRNGQFHIPFYGSQGSFKSVPYVSVLRGEVPIEFLAHKNILIGTTSSGMTDSYPTPASGNDGAMPGIEINATILSNLLDGKAIIFAEPWQCALFSVIPILLALLSYLLFSPRLALISVGSLFVMGLVASFIILKLGIWVPPSAALIVLLISYPVWTWRRLEGAIRYLNIEFKRLNSEPNLLPEIDKPTKALSNRLFSDSLEQRINSMEIAAQRVRDLRQFVTDSLQSLPDATLVTNIDGHVILINYPAEAYFKKLGIKNLKDALLPYLFSTMLHPHPVEQANSEPFSWWHLLDLKYIDLMKNGIEVTDQHGSSLIIKSAPCTNAQHELIGWIVGINDISTIRKAERSRDESLRFISHDMRAPQASILALLELQQQPESALPMDELMERIAKASRVTLSLADNFVQLAQAEGQTYRLEVVAAQDMIQDAIDEMWSLAKAKNIALKAIEPNEEYLVQANRALMTRVLTNLISNAIKYSPENTVVTLSMERKIEMLNDRVLIHIADQGYGIAWADQAKMFQRFQRFTGENQPKTDGVGLGLVFVKSVLDRHQAPISFVSKPNEGTTFTISLAAYYET